MATKPTSKSANSYVRVEADPFSVIASLAAPVVTLIGWLKARLGVKNG